MITVKIVQKALEKLNRMKSLAEYESFMTEEVKTILLTKFLNDEVDKDVKHALDG